MSMAVFSTLADGVSLEENRKKRKPAAGRRRIFVQTDTGCVLAMDLDRDDNAHTVKRRLQICLNVPVEGSSLIFGDKVLKNDLSAIQNHSPLLLSRMHRSSSSPCLSPTGKDFQHGDQSGPIEILYRHGGNILVRELKAFGRFGEVEIFPIDHGLCLPENLEDPYFEWIHWPQASIPFSKEELEYIEKLDPYKDSEMLRRQLPMIREACLRVLILCTTFLKKASTFGLCLSEIGEMMTRQFHTGVEEPSELEFVCLKAKRLISEMEAFSPKDDAEENDVFQFDMDCKELSQDSSTNSCMIQPPLQSGFGDSIEEEEEEEITGKRQGERMAAKMPNVSKLSMSLENTALYEKPKYLKSSGHKTAGEQLASSVTFVEFSDMNDEKWALFLDKFQELLYPTFSQRKSVTLAQKQNQRLGTSCQF
ncbi:hypothetical protein ACET3Z_031918 [Daucus carota]